ERADQRHTAVERGAANGPAQAPALAALRQQFVDAGRERVGTHRGHVLVAERVADQRVVVRVGAPGERAEGRWHLSHLDVEVARRPRPDAHERRVRANLAEIIRAYLTEQ